MNKLPPRKYIQKHERDKTNTRMKLETGSALDSLFHGGMNLLVFL